MNEVAVDFLHQVEDDADDDEQAGAAVEGGDLVGDFEFAADDVSG